jgi:phenylacetate-CoA ligase
VLDLFREASDRVPAYRDFLAGVGVEPAEIDSPAALARVPPVSKRNYLRAYPWRELLLDGNCHAARVVSTSSGSSGVPFYWPRDTVSQAEAASTYQRLVDHFGGRTRESLVVISFAMGNWIAGTYTLDAMQCLSDADYPLTTITPGIDVAASVRALADLAPSFEQTILCGYPPLVKDVLDAATAAGVDLQRLGIRVILAGEVISESWRGHLAGLFGGDPSSDILLIYGTADMGAVGTESPATVWLRRQAVHHEAVRSALFGEVSTLPTLVEIDPAQRYVESVDGSLLLTARGALPLIRYAIGDVGLVHPSDEVRAELMDALDGGLPAAVDRALSRPLVTVGGRPDVAASFYALNLYPENIKHGLEAADVRAMVSGKFVVRVTEDGEAARPTLRVLVELADGQRRDSVDGQVRAAVIAGLVETNAEYRQLHAQLGDLAEPVVELAEFGRPDFAIDAKHRWTEPS